MSKHPFLEEAKSTHTAKMKKEGVMGEGLRDRAKRIAYADGGSTTGPTHSSFVNSKLRQNPPPIQPKPEPKPINDGYDPFSWKSH